MKAMWSIACLKGIVDKESNQISLVDIFDRFQLPLLPNVEAMEKRLPKGGVFLIPFPWQLVTLWSRTDPDKPEIGEARTKLISPDGNVVARSRMEINLIGTLNYRAILKFPGLPYAGLGVYSLMIHGRKDGATRWKRFSQLRLEVQGPRATSAEYEG